MSELYCRVCANGIEGLQTVPLFGNAKSDDLRNSLIEFGDISIADGDGLPTFVCMSCKYKLNAAVRFRALCQHNDAIFRQKFLPIKNETLANNSDDDDVKFEPICEIRSCDGNDEIFNEDTVHDDTEDCVESPSEKATNNNVKPFTRKYIRRKPLKPKSNKKRCQKGRILPRHICDVCGLSVVNLKEHNYIHKVGADARYPCNICEKAYAQRKGLAHHMKTHTNEKNFTCPHCPQRFMINKYLKRHLRVHTGERPYPCHLCDKAFQTRYNLRTHIRSHTRERPYKCDYCEERFIHRAVLNIHVKRHKEQQQTDSENGQTMFILSG